MRVIQIKRDSRNPVWINLDTITTVEHVIGIPDQMNIRFGPFQKTVLVGEEVAQFRELLKSHTLGAIDARPYRHTCHPDLEV